MDLIDGELQEKNAVKIQRLEEWVKFLSSGSVRLRIKRCLRESWSASMLKAIGDGPQEVGLQKTFQFK